MRPPSSPSEGEEGRAPHFVQSLDLRGVHRVFSVELTADTWRFWNDTPGFAQRITHTLGDPVMRGQGELSTDDGATWEDDLALTYRRVG